MVPIRRFGARRLALSVVCVVASSAAIIGTSATAGSARPAVGSATVTDISDFNSYVCDQPGFVGFENVGADTTLTAGTIPGLRFSTDNTAKWRVRDFAAGTNDGEKFPAGPFTSEQTHFGEADGATTATIALTDGLASTFSVLVSDYSSATLQAFGKSGGSLGRTPAHVVPDGRHMAIFKITQPLKKIASVKLRVNGADFAIDSICTDAAGVPTPQLTLTSTDGPPTSATTVEGTGFSGNEQLKIELNGVLNGYVTTQADGTFSRPMTIVQSAAPGAAVITATNASQTESGTANFFVHQDWPQIGFNAGRTAWNRTENQISTANASSLRQDWLPDGGLTGGRPAGEIVVDGVVYTTSNDGAAYAFNDQTGALLWSCVPGADPCAPDALAPARPTKIVALRGAPAYAGGRLFVPGADGNVWALDPATGAPLWHYSIGTPLGKAPLVVGNAVYVSSTNGSVYAIGQQKGKLLWQWTSPIAGDSIDTAPASDGKRIFVGSDSGTFFAINITDGTTAWSKTTGAQIRSGPAVAKNAVYVGSADGSVYAWKTDGTALWTHPTGQPVGAGIAVGLDHVYVGDEGGLFLELSASSGLTINSFDTGAPIITRATIANGVVYVTGSSQQLYVLDANTLTQETSFAVGSSPGEISVANGAVYIGSDSNRIDKFDLP